MTGIDLIAAERERQTSQEGWTADHDAQHLSGELAQAAASYALPPDVRRVLGGNEVMQWPPRVWPFEEQWWKPCPNDRVRELVKAGALIAAEIDRLQA